MRITLHRLESYLNLDPEIAILRDQIRELREKAVDCSTHISHINSQKSGKPDKVANNAAAIVDLERKIEEKEGEKTAVTSFLSGMASDNLILSMIMTHKFIDDM
jgi:predicted  nucleic acid-binding Zn-ribbon protein